DGPRRLTGQRDVPGHADRDRVVARREVGRHAVPAACRGIAMAEPVAPADRVVAAAAVVGTAETVAPEPPAVPVRATVRIVQRARPIPARVPGVAEAVAAAD